MNVAFFLMPKSQVVWLSTRATLAQAIRRMEDSGCTALPLLDDDERYAGTIRIKIPSSRRPRRRIRLNGRVAANRA